MRSQDIGAYEIGDSWTAGATWRPDFSPWSFLSLGTNENNKEIGIKVFPNPVDNQVLNISIPNELSDSSLTAFNIRGQKVLEFQNIPNSLDVSSLKKGLYFFLFSNKEGLNISKFNSFSQLKLRKSKIYQLVALGLINVNENKKFF